MELPEQDLKALREHAREVLDRFPWPAEGPHGESGAAPVRVFRDVQTPQEGVAEQKLVALRGAIKGLLTEIDAYFAKDAAGRLR